MKQLKPIALHGLLLAGSFMIIFFEANINITPWDFTEGGLWFCYAYVSIYCIGLPLGLYLVLQTLKSEQPRIHKLFTLMLLVTQILVITVLRPDVSTAQERMFFAQNKTQLEDFAEAVKQANCTFTLECQRVLPEYRELFENYLIRIEKSNFDGLTILISLNHRHDGSFYYFETQRPHDAFGASGSCNLKLNEHWYYCNYCNC